MGKKMRFGCLVKDHVAEVRERDLPEVGPEEVLVKRLANNICTTDYQQWMGLREHQGYPMAGGHEGSGIVEAVGSNVTTIKVGDLVGVMDYGCGKCEDCRSGHQSLCTKKDPKATTADGYYGGMFGFGDYNVSPADRLFVMNPKLDPSEAGFLEPLATVCKGMEKLRIQPMETVVVIGAGTMGLLNAQAAKAKGARVIVSELMEKKLETAKAMGFEVIDGGKCDAVQAVKDLTDGVGVDCVIVAVGATVANDQALQMIKKTDGRILLFAAGYPVPEIHVDSNVLHYRRIELIGTFGADFCNFAESAKMLNTGAVDVSKLVEPKKFTLDQIQDAFAAASEPGMYRVSVLLDK